MRWEKGQVLTSSSLRLNLVNCFSLNDSDILTIDFASDQFLNFKPCLWSMDAGYGSLFECAMYVW